jgi:hypothetical protein
MKSSSKNDTVDFVLVERFNTSLFIILLFYIGESVIFIPQYSTGLFA